MIWSGAAFCFDCAPEEFKRNVVAKLGFIGSREKGWHELGIKTFLRWPEIAEVNPYGARCARRSGQGCESRRLLFENMICAMTSGVARACSSKEEDRRHCLATCVKNVDGDPASVLIGDDEARRCPAAEVREVAVSMDVARGPSRLYPAGARMAGQGKEVKTFHLDLPLPPSANDLWRIALRPGGARLVKTDRYTAWWDEAGYGTAFPQGWEGFAGIVLLYVDCGQLGRGRDVDNCIKPVQDLCAKMLGVNDSCFRFCAAFESDSHGIQKGRVGVTLVMVEG
jgi:hypothetical protein